MPICGDDDLLRQFVNGELTPDQFESVDQHLDECGRCSEAVEGLIGHTELVQALRLPDDSGRYDDEPGLKRTLSKIRHRITPPQIPGFRDLELVGVGGMGLVYRAFHEGLHQTRAIKVLSEAQASDPQRIQRFEREMRAAARLDSPHVVRALDTGLIDGVPYFVMEWVDGRDLAQVLSGGQSLHVTDACEIVRQAALGLQHAHDHGLVHRDIKPSNLLLKSDGTVKVADFGLAVLTERDEGEDQLTSYGRVVGTADYIAPEQCEDSSGVDHRADIYSLGATLYRLLVGEAPFSGPEFSSVFSKMQAHVTGPAPLVSRQRHGISRDLDELVTRMMAQKPDDRPSSANEVATLLEPFCNGADTRQLRLLESEDSERDETVLLPMNRSAPLNKRRFAVVAGIVGAAVIVAALLLRDREVTVMSERLTMAVPVQEDQPASEEKPSTVPLDAHPQSAQRVALQLVLDLGGQLQLIYPNSGIPVELKAGDQLPDGPLPVRSITVVKVESFTSDEIARLGDLPKLEFLHFNWTSVDDFAMAQISRFTSLREISAFNTAISDEGLSHLWKLKNLELLNLRGIAITDEGLSHFAGLDQLRFLDLGHTSPTGTGLRSLAGLQKLTHLILDYSKLNDDGFRQVCRLTPLTHLQLRGTSITSDGAQSISQLSELTVLQLDETAIDDDAVNEIAKLPKLEELSLKGTQISDAALAALSSMQTLKHLDLSLTRISDDGLNILAGLSALKTLVLTETGVTASGVSAFEARMPECVVEFGVRDLRIARLCLNARGTVRFHGQQDAITDASEIPNDEKALIQEIDLSQASDPSELIPHVASLDSLHGLKLHSTKLKSDRFHHLGQCPELQFLWLYNSQFDNGALWQLKKLITLKLLDLGSTSVIDEELKSLPPNLTTLSLVRTAISDTGLENLVHLKHLTDLSVQETQVTADGVRKFQTARPDCVVHH